MIENQLRDMEKQGLISPAPTARICSSLLAVPKPDNTLRLTVDYRQLNMHTVKDTYPLPNIEANLAALGTANLFTTADLLSGFHQVELDDEAIPKTAFSAPQGQVAYSRMPMGLTSSPGTLISTSTTTW
mgnify:CR=1 FL=1